MKTKNILKLIASIIICGFAGVFGSVFTMPEITGWYAELIKPSFNPPDWVFGPVWTILYLLMGISLFLVWKNNWKIINQIIKPSRKAWNRWSEKLWVGDWKKQNAIGLFVLQLFFNILWSMVFFGFHSLAWGFAIILMLWFSIIYVIVNFYRISKPAAWLLVPYLLWVSFAAVLNFAIFWLN